MMVYLSLTAEGCHSHAALLQQLGICVKCRYYEPLLAACIQTALHCIRSLELNNTCQSVQHMVMLPAGSDVDLSRIRSVTELAKAGAVLAPEIRLDTELIPPRVAAHS